MSLASLLLLCILAVLHGGAWRIFPALPALAVVFLQALPFRSLVRERGFGPAIAAALRHLVQLVTSAARIAVDVIRRERKQDPWFPFVMIFLAALVFAGVQFAGGAYRAEFDGQSDESAHFLTGLMLRDFLVQLPLAHPVSWAEQYYLHYPKVAFGHWPPLFHITEALWWLFVPPSRTSVLILVGLFGVLAAGCFYRLARELAPPAVALALTCLLIAAEVFQESAGQVMAELLTLWLGMMFLAALISLLRGGSPTTLVRVGIWCALCLMVKGTGICLIPAPFIALLLSRQMQSAALRKLAFGAAGAIVGFGLFSLVQNRSLAYLAAWAGLRSGLPWKIEPFFKLAGVGFAALAGAGILIVLGRRKPDPVAAASAAMVLAVAGTSFFVRAISEPRHWILALPGVLLLGLSAVRGIAGAAPSGTRILAAGLAAAAALALFPWSRYQQQPVGYRDLAVHIRQPGRMLVSGAHGWEEGSWIALASLREKRPSSVIVRATKVLAAGGWNTEDYGLRVTTRAEVEATLDRLGIETVILDEHLGVPLAHHRLLRETVTASPAWRECAQSASLFAYCRVLPPKLPREPLRIDVGQSLGRTIVER